MLNSLLTKGDIVKKIMCIWLCLLILLCGCNVDNEPDKTNPSKTTSSSTTIATDGGTNGSTSGSHNSSAPVTPPGSTTGSYIPGTTSSGTGGTHTTTDKVTGTTAPTLPICAHKDSNNDTICDVCRVSVIITFDFYSINDLHGKFADADSNIGVDELTSYLKNARKTDENAIFLSAGDMWQGSSESNMTKGKIVVDWMNELDFAAMAIGNHEFDWGEEYVASNAAMAEFPFIAINIYDRQTNALASFCTPSVMVEGDGLQIGIIGAIGDCYSSIAVDKCDEVYFKTGRDLTNLVKNEADRLRREGADFIVYVLHDGYGQSKSGQMSSSQLASYYDISLSDGYVDLVFEGHTHQGYRIQDEHGVYHLQNKGDNKGGISHVEIAINAVTMDSSVNIAELVNTYVYQNLEDDAIVNQLMDKYQNQIAPADRVLGYNTRYRRSDELLQTAAQLYYEVGEKTWGDKYKIVLGGGFMSARSPYNLPAGEVTYGELQTILPFDNQLMLCSIKGSYLRSKFLETSNDRYYIHCGTYGNSIRNNIDPSATYYVITDSYSAYYAPNHLTVIEEYDPNVFARDLLADYIEAGNFS